MGSNQADRKNIFFKCREIEEKEFEITEEIQFISIDLKRGFYSVD
jgi:hypothetical protein